MITPADLARMLSHASATVAGHHARPAFEPDRLLYTSESRQAPDAPAPDKPPEPDQGGAQQHDGGKDIPPSVAPAPPTPASVFAKVKAARPAAAPQATSDAVVPEAEPVEPDEAAAVVEDSAPTPAMMPRRRASDGPTTFASLDAQELPVVREYSAGGLVFDEQGRVAVIARHSRSGHLEWCLPKGHIEKGETPQQTAVREVFEETGILGEVVDSIATIDYWFTGTSQRVHKLVHHYALRQIGGDLTVEGDPDHEAEDAIWVRFEDLDDVLSYLNERKIAWLYARKMNRQANE
ncbi:NUDIX hydrolase [Bifidobacterium pullorum]|nr:NUDIX hydrolase [Bifidobacterium pullorum]